MSDTEKKDRPSQKTDEIEREILLLEERLGYAYNNHQCRFLTRQTAGTIPKRLSKCILSCYMTTTSLKMQLRYFWASWHRHDTYAPTGTDWEARCDTWHNCAPVAREIWPF